jgi:hypothetical protein
MAPGLKNGTWEAFVVVLVGAFFAVLGTGWTCLVRSWCLDAGTCRAVNRSSIFPAAQCSFETVVPLVSDLLYHNSTGSSSNLEALTRGMCGVGERLHLSVITGQPECMLLRPYPDALDQEVMKPDASTDHERACGGWLASGMTMSLGGVQYPEYLSFDDSSERGSAVAHAEDAMHAGSRLSAGNLGKFRAACQRAVLGGSSAVRAAGERAYDFLVTQAAIDSIVDENTALHSTGKLASYYCDGPVVFGYEMKSAGYRASSRRGTAFQSNEMAQALQLVNGPYGLQSQAEAGNAHVNEHAFTTPDASVAQLMAAYRGGTGRASSEDGAANMGRYESVPELDGLIHLVNSGANGVNKAKGYLKGVAAMCAFSLSAIVAAPGYTAAPGPEGYLIRARSRRPRSAALGQLAKPSTQRAAMDFEVEREHVLNASSITLSQLVGGDAGGASAMCRDFTRLMFPDEIDAIHHELVISPRLYDRMELIVSQARAGVAHVLRNNAALRAAITDPDSIALDVEATRIRIPGAPRGTWAGTARAIPLANFDSSDGIFIMAAKQASALWNDRQSSLVYTATNPCDGPSAYAPLTANAYIFPGYRCSYYLLGMSFRPFADEAYDGASLMGRFGYIIAHELAHNNLNSAYASGILSLLQDYPCVSTRNEGWADVAGCLGVLHTGYLNSTELCEHVSQAWCARTPVGYAGCSGQSHPKANVRGDSLCNTLRRLGV